VIEVTAAPEVDEFSWADAYEGEIPAGSGRVRVAKSRGDRAAKSLLEWTVVAVIALLVTMILRTFVLAAFFIPSESMYPTLHINDRVLVNKLSYKMHPLHRGDVVVFKRPPGEPDISIKDLIKRVIGLPGDTVQFHDGKVFVNELELVEPYLARPDSTVPHGANSIVVPAGQVLVLGDNRTNSFDGRFFGTFDQKLIVGRAFVLVWPPSRFGSL
jgi:signal peptidase I